MANLSLGAATIQPCTAAGATTPWTVGTYYALPPVGNPPLEGDAEYDELPVAFAGVDGVGTKNLGFRGRDITIDLLFVQASEAAAQTAKNALIAALRVARFSVTVPGGTARPGCRLKRGGFSDGRWLTISRRHVLFCTVQIRQMNT